MSDVESKLRALGERTAEQVRHGEIPSARIVRRVRMRRGAAALAAGTAAVLLATVVYPRVADTLRDRSDGGPVRLAAIAEATEDAGSARIEMEMTMEFSTRETTMHATGVVDFANERSLVRMGDAGADGRAVVEMMTIGDSAFQRVLTDGEEPPKWYEMEIPPGADAGWPGESDPSDFLSYLRSVAEEVTDLGTEVVDGTEVRHYRAEIEMPSSPGAMPPGIEVDLEPMEVWVDSLGRLRRLSFGATTEGLTPEYDGSMQMTMRLWDFGVPVEVVAPGPDDLSDERPEWPSGAAAGDATLQDPSDATFITGADHWEGPYVMVAEAAGGMSFLCVNGLPVTWREVAVVQESSGRSVLTLGPEHRQPGAGGAGSTACGKTPVSHEDADALKGDPDDFILRIERRKGGEIVELEQTGSFADIDG